ncbi:hypothetical protein ACT3TZ_13775 [Brachybacterium sp. AOP25-B2-12]|uniref:hypothetical protein n=1 Tax=Brachybacterium sp. AOP25-B2-12 TaxID=3457710 RepID=UPI0040341FD3
MSIDRARAEHAAKYDANLIIPAREYLALITENEALREEQALGGTHANNPYPTDWAYEQACTALETQRRRAQKAERENERLHTVMATYSRFTTPSTRLSIVPDPEASSNKRQPAPRNSALPDL